jgi:outer membrane receptor protein involved in Fe transport
MRFFATGACVLACLSSLEPALAQQNRAAELETGTVEVVGTTPLPGLGTPLSQVPANVQGATGDQITEQHSHNITEYMETNLGNVSINEGQVNPYMPDVNFRGFTASPLLGTPQGLSVFFDGVRVNEPFGDVVNWDLIPQNALSTINLIPGSNPVFGLNTLGAALSLSTKSGLQYPGGSASLQGGSWGRKQAEFEYGGQGQSLDYFFAGNFADEDGWRQHSSSRVQQFFTKVGRETETSDFDVSLTLADNKLEGVQALPMSMLGDRNQSYTWPDRNKNELFAVNAKASHFLSAERLLAGNVYVRHYKNSNFSSNVNDECTDNTVNANFCNIGAGGGAANGEPQGANDTSTVRTLGYGGSVQMTFLEDLDGKKNAATVGFSADLGNTDFEQSNQAADFTADRGTTVDQPTTLQTKVRTTNAYYGLYATDTYSLNEKLHLTLSGRYNVALTRIEDQSGQDPLLNGSNQFTRFNPAAGLNFNPDPALNTYVSYSEGMRAPTPVELTCADPNAPCKLPNNFLADPPLNMVVSKTVETGARGKLGNGLTWNAALYNTDLKDDIQFVSAGAGALNAGYFQNVGSTRRRGMEFGVGFAHGPLNVSAHLGFVRATYETDFTIHSPANSGADPTTGDIPVSKGNRIPGIPERSLKLRVAYAFADNFGAGINLVNYSDQYARGDENNADSHGKVPGYSLVHLDAHYQVTDRIQFFGRVSNLFDQKYETLGVLGNNFFVNGTFDAQNVEAEQFRSPGSPRAVWVGVRYDFDKPKKAD